VKVVAQVLLPLSARVIIRGSFATLLELGTGFYRELLGMRTFSFSAPLGFHAAADGEKVL